MYLLLFSVAVHSPLIRNKRKKTNDNLDRSKRVVLSNLVHDNRSPKGTQPRAPSFKITWTVFSCRRSNSPASPTFSSLAACYRSPLHNPFVALRLTVAVLFILLEPNVVARRFFSNLRLVAHLSLTVWPVAFSWYCSRHWFVLSSFFDCRAAVIEQRFHANRRLCSIDPWPISFFFGNWCGYRDLQPGVLA